VDVTAMVRWAKSAVFKALGQRKSAAQDGDILTTLKQEHDQINRFCPTCRRLKTRQSDKLSLSGSSSR
jgi:hypothetical protein